ncbi:sugar phosphate isomerase/epimerase [Phenylobacterium sp.]|uniref:sugar phosphate isomerase/epimerase family protein n=1 Tax=Phenylobacterium sp. TaxID=1871053 RepID=UPI002810BC4D|nr:sugar phosphate isomerase/epimerase [Phenylobacterium sp.]
MRPTLDLPRRSFLAAGAAALVSSPACAAPFFQRTRLPIGLQLYTLGPDAGKDLDATLAAVAKIGYRDVELPGFMGCKPAELRAALDKAGLTCRSAHIQPRGGFDGDLAKLVDDLATIGVKNAVAPSPYVPEHALKAAAGAGADSYRKMTAALSADDYKMNADLLNRTGAALKKAGIAVGYHNHNFEFAPKGDTNGLEILLKNTDASLVTFEADVGWMAAAGVDPLPYIQKHKGRFTLMHVKDIKASTKPNFELRMDPTEVGSGRLDWKRLLSGAHAAGVRYFYVEQEPPFERPRLEAARLCHDFLARLNA